MKVFFDFFWVKDKYLYLCKSNRHYSNSEYYFCKAYEVL